MSFPAVLSFFLLSSLQAPPAEDVEALLAGLKTEDASARRAAFGKLLRLGPAAVPAALRVLEDAAPNPSERVALLVKKLSSRAWKERDGAMEELSRLGRAARAALEEHAGAADPEVAWRVRAALADIQDKAGRDELLEEIRATALCEFLGEAGDGRAVPTLLRVLAAGAPEQRAELKRRAAEALGKLRAKLGPAQADEAAARVLSMLERTAPAKDKSLLVKALAGLRSPACVRPLEALLADRSEKNVNLKRNCMAALAASGDPRGLRAVIEALSAEDVYVRQGAAAVLEEASGERPGFDPRAAGPENRAAIDAFRAWWSKKFNRPWE
jgi:hypothetical protein